DERQRHLDELTKKRGTGPLGAKGGPLGRGATGPLGAKRLGEKKPEITPPRSLGRQVEGGFDPTAAVNSTYAAYQHLKERQEERARETEERQPPGAPPLMPSPAWDPAAEVAPAPPRPAPGVPAAKKPGTGALGTGSLARPPAKPELRKPATGPLKPAAAAPRPEPPAAPPAASGGPSWIDQSVPAAPQRPEPVVPPRAEEMAPPRPEPAAVSRPEPAAMPVEKPLPSAKAFLCQVRVLDALSGEAMHGARLEFEPSEDDLLPVVNVVTDAHGWYRANDLPHGRYQLTVRAPGYIPQGLPVAVEAGKPFAEIVRMEKP
ncbi:MAG: carboxypeptidase regulatory-like domain-containing protein, partial [Candidatus Sericytochromatia bacterium]